MQDPTLALHWAFSALAFMIMTTRLLWRKILGQKLDIGDGFTTVALVCLLARAALIDVVLTWGTNNMPASYRATHEFTDQEIYQREIGSKFVIADRAIYNSYLWLQKLALLDIFRKLTIYKHWHNVVIRSYWAVFAVTYVASQVITFTECDPFHLYWQVVPDPGSCVEAQDQLFVMGISNIITDSMLLALPAPIFLNSHTSRRRKLQLCALFSLGLFLIAITIVRLPLNHEHASSQVNRSTWASTELLTSAIAVNAPILYGLGKRTCRLRASKSSSVGLHRVESPQIHKTRKGWPSVLLEEEADEECLTGAVAPPASLPRTSMNESIEVSDYAQSWHKPP